MWGNLLGSDTYLQITNKGCVCVLGGRHIEGLLSSPRCELKEEPAVWVGSLSIHFLSHFLLTEPCFRLGLWEISGVGLLQLQEIRILIIVSQR